MSLKPARILKFFHDIFPEAEYTISDLAPQVFIYDYCEDDGSSMLEFDPYLLSGDVVFWGVEINELLHNSERAQGFLIFMIVESTDKETRGDDLDLVMITHYSSYSDEMRTFTATMDLEFFEDDIDTPPYLIYDYGKPDMCH